MFCEVTLLRAEGRRLRPDEYPAPVSGWVTVESWAQNSSRRFIRTMSLQLRWGTSRRGGPVMADPILVPGPAGGFLFAGTELVSKEGRIHEVCQMWFVRPMEREDSELEPFAWTPAILRNLPQP